MKCDYGCGKEAIHQFKNGKWCCSKYLSQCEVMKQKNRISNIDKFKDPEKLKKQKEHLARIRPKQTKLERLEKSKKIKEVWRDLTSKYHTEEYKTLRSKVTKDFYKDNPHPNLGGLSYNRWTLEKIKIKYPFFYSIEKPIEINGKINIKCKLCGKLFAPNYEQLRGRMNALERPEGKDGLYFYCSDICKQQCPIYGKSPEQLIKEDIGDIDNRIPTSSEDKIFKDEVIRRVEQEYGQIQCEICGNINKNELSVHHEKPRKTNPEMSLDPDNGWVLCSFGKGNNCHLKIGHSDKDCNTGNLSTRVCFSKYEKQT